ncbi:MAG TPA: hypothetical protein VJ841_03445 [Candidatus Saccharimonadales bacterium]|nr:hypothetical protein [Candidatus Saccharimonadales bacterium]
MITDKYEEEKQLDRIRSEIESTMEGVKGKFAPGTLLTLLVRHPALPESSMLLTEDSPEEVIKEINSFISR